MHVAVMNCQHQILVPLDIFQARHFEAHLSQFIESDVSLVSLVTPIVR